MTVPALVPALLATWTDAWGVWGLTAQILFTGSFAIQWLASERAGRSVVPMAFWYLRLAGSGMLLTYALFGRQGAVIVLGQTFGASVYLRNLSLSRRRPVGEPHG